MKRIVEPDAVTVRCYWCGEFVKFPRIVIEHHLYQNRCPACGKFISLKKAVYIEFIKQNRFNPHELGMV
jgi:DNA-directed RNA polymerase subunit N (RpoN/RPB10)